jgi:DNA repair protein RecN (Recombination protein N)
MLKSLYIKNFAIITEQSLQFDDGLNIIIGETGAGKSIILEAIGILLGKKASKEMIRRGCDKSVIEGTFIDEKLGYQIDDESFSKEFIIRKEINKSGTSRLFLNDTLVQLNDIKQLSGQLANYHTQDENIVLRDEESHIDFFDDFIDFKNLKQDYKSLRDNIYSEYRKLKELIKNKENSLAQKDYLEYQLAEINKINPQKGELEEVNEKLQLIENAELILHDSNELTNLTLDSDDGIYFKMRRIIELINQLGNYNKDFLTYLEELNSSLISINELGNLVSDFGSDISYNPTETENIRKRSVELRGIIKKYGTVDEILEKKEQMEEELSLIENYDHYITVQKENIYNLEVEIGHTAQNLSQLRLENSTVFSKNLINSLKEMGIPHADFKVAIENQITDRLEPKAIIKTKQYKLFEEGIDKIQFLAAMNKGEGLKQLSEFASGGELSRILLSLKGNNINSNYNPVLILDEIDTGISGRVSQLVGIQMRKISQNIQIIAITHSPQIAAAGDTNFVVKKEVVGERTVSNIYNLNESEKEKEIASLISGKDTSINAINNAKELIASFN